MTVYNVFSALRFLEGRPSKTADQRFILRYPEDSKALKLLS